MILPACRKLWRLSSCKNHIYPLPVSWNITKRLQTCYFGYFGHAWPIPPKAITLTCTKLSCLSSNNFSLKILNFREFCNLISQEHLGINSITRILPDMRFVIESQETKEFSFGIIFEKKNEKKIQKYAKYPVFGSSLPKVGEK